MHRLVEELLLNMQQKKAKGSEEHYSYWSQSSNSTTERTPMKFYSTNKLVQIIKELAKFLTVQKVLMTVEELIHNFQNVLKINGHLDIQDDDGK